MKLFSDVKHGVMNHACMNHPGVFEWMRKKDEAAGAAGMAIGVFSIVIVGYLVFAILPDFFYQAFLAGDNGSAPAGAEVLLKTVVPIAVVALFVFAIVKKFK